MGGEKKANMKACKRACVSELQASVDSLLAEKLHLQRQVEELTKELSHLRDQVGGLHVHMHVIQRIVTLPLSYLPACPGGRGERGPAEELKQAEQELEQNQTR